MTCHKSFYRNLVHNRRVPARCVVHTWKCAQLSPSYAHYRGMVVKLVWRTRGDRLHMQQDSGTRPHQKPPGAPRALHGAAVQVAMT